MLIFLEALTSLSADGNILPQKTIKHEILTVLRFIIPYKFYGIYFVSKVNPYSKIEKFGSFSG